MLNKGFKGSFLRSFKSCEIIHTYKRKETSLTSCSFYERLCGDSLAECSARATNIEDRLPNGCCSSRENKKAKREEWSASELSNARKFYQSQSSESFDAPPVKFKYTRLPKEQRKSGGSFQHVAAFPLILEESQSISRIDTTQPELDRLCCDPCSRHDCRNAAMQPCGSLLSTNFRKEEKNLCWDFSIMSANESSYRDASILHNIDHRGRDTEDGSSFQNCVELGEMKSAAPLQTYSRRSKDKKNSHMTYVALMAERSTYLVCDRSISENAESPVHQAVVKTMNISESEIVDEHMLLLSQSHGKLTEIVSSVSNMLCSQENQKVRNGCPLFDDTDVSTIPSFNDEVVTGQPDKILKPHHNISDLYIHTISEKPSIDTVMASAYESVIDTLQNHSHDSEKAGAASKDLSDQQRELDSNLAASTKCQEDKPLQSEPLQQSVEKIKAASEHAEDPKANSEVLGTMGEEIKETNAVFDTNVKPSKDPVSASLMNKVADPFASPNPVTRSKVLQLFPEDATDALQHSTSKTGHVPPISSYICSVTVALPDWSVSREIKRDKVVQSSSNQASEKLLLDSIRSSNRPRIEATEGFHQKFQPFASIWCEEELDNLWVGVRRHGKDNWYAILGDPRLQFTYWRTARDLAEKWTMEQTKLLGSTPGSQDQPSNPAGAPLDSYRSVVPPFMPPGPGFMTRFLTDPMQLSLSNAHMNKQGQGMFLPRPPHNSISVPGNGTSLFNRRVRAHRKTQRRESSWGRFKVGNQVMPPPRLPSLASTSRINMLPSYFGDALHYPHPLPPLPVPSLSAQHWTNQTSLHVKLNDNGMGSSSQSGFHLSETVTDCSILAAFETKPTDPKRRKVSVNLESDASSEGTISDDE